jgi:hypothetical protein
MLEVRPTFLGRCLLIALVLFAGMPAVLMAQEVITIPVDISDWAQLIPVVVAVLAPLALGWVKRLLLREVIEPDGSVVAVLPGWFPKWLPLLLAPAMIWVADLLVTWVGGSPGISPWILALLMPLPTWLREIADQVRKAKSGESHSVVKLITTDPPFDPRIADRPLGPTETGESDR